MAPLDIGLCVFLMVAWPVYEKWIDGALPAWVARVPSRARIREFRMTIIQQWLLTAIAAFIWLHAGRSWESIGMRPVWGWRLLASAALALALIALNAYQVLILEKNEKARRGARNSKSITSVEMILPRGDTELRWFFLVSMSAGFCEEFLFRGYLINVLAPILTWWGRRPPLFHSDCCTDTRARTASSTAVVGVFMTLIVAATRSLIPRYDARDRYRRRGRGVHNHQAARE
jgi:hypothetical protein